MPDEARRGLKREAGHPRHALQVVDERARVQLARQRLAVAHPGALPRLPRGLFRRRRVDGLQHLGAALAVDRRVVELGVEGEAALRDAGDVVEPLDDVRLPQRLAAVERPRVDARHLDAELAPVTRGRQCDVAHVELDVDVVVLDPVGTVEVERHRDQAAPEDRRAVEPRLEEIQDVLEPHEPARRRRRVVDAEPGDVHVLVAMFQAQEHVVHSGKLLHGLTPGIDRLRCRLPGTLL